MNRILDIDDNELRQLGRYLGININALSGDYTCKKQFIMNYVIYSHLEYKVDLWFKKYNKIAISYSYSLETWALILRDKLIENGYEPIMNQTHINLSDRSISSFEKILSEQFLLVCIINKKYLKSFNCMREFYLLCQKYDFNTTEICKHLIAVWDKNIKFSLEIINDIAEFWENEMQRQNEQLQRNYHAIRQKEVIDMDMCAKIYHHSLEMLHIIKDVSAFRIQRDIEPYIPNILSAIESRLKSYGN